MQDLASSLEHALKYRVKEGGYEVTVFTGSDDYTKANPSLTIHAQQGNEFPIGSGNFTVSVACEFRMSAEEGSIPHFRSLSRDVFGQLMDSSLPVLLSTEADDLHVFGITDRNFSTSIDENKWLATLNFNAYCCLTDLS